MAERKYYWIKLKKDFMNSDAVDFLMSQKNGAEYVVLYQMLCLMTVKTNGKLERQLNEVIIPYDAEKIQRDTKYFNIDTVRNALQLYIHLGLIYKDDNGCLSIANYDNLVGSESGSAERVRRFRNSKALHCNDDVTDMKRISNELSNTDIDIDKEIDIDTDKEVINTNISCNLEVDKNGSYTAKNRTGIPHGCQLVAERLPQVRLGKDSIGKDSIDINKNTNINKEIVTKTTNRPRVKFVKPTVEEIEAFAKEQNLRNLDAQYFYNYYESNGWMVGKNHMKDWKATAKNWNRRELKNKTVIKMPDYMREQADAKTFRELEEEGKCPF